MRKTIIALMIVFPMCFVLVLFSSVNIVSLNVNISVNGIEIITDTDEDYLVLDMAASPRTIEARVTPGNATEKGYSLASSDETVLKVTEDGTLIGLKEGNATVTATSNDRSYTDSIDVSVMSSKPYDIGLELFDINGDKVELDEKNNTYTASVGTGKFTYSAYVRPAGYEYEFTADENSYAQIDRGSNTVFLPFRGTADLTLTVRGGIDGDIVKKIRLDASSDANILVNGNADKSIVLLATGETKTSLFVESATEPDFRSDTPCDVSVIELGRFLGRGRYRLDITINAELTDGFEASIVCGDKSASINFEFKDYDFFVSADGIEMEKNDDGEYIAAVEKNKQLSLYAVPAVGKADVQYRWEQLSGKNIIEPSENMCVFRAKEYGRSSLKVSAISGGKTLMEYVINVNVVDMYFSILMPSDKNVGYAECFTIGGYRYDGTDKIGNEYALNIVQLVYDPDRDSQSGGDPTKYITGLDELEFSISDTSIADYEVKSDPQTGKDTLVIIPKGTGKVTIGAYWKWNNNFKMKIGETRTFYVVSDAVVVKNAPELVKATNEAQKVVLGKDIMLGTDADGNVFSPKTLESMLGTMKSTYNIEWYKKTGRTSSARISYVMEFKNDVYGNGHFINAENFTHCVDDTDSPLINKYKDPLYFVNLNDTAAVSAQDNCAFLIRTDGVTLYGVDLLGCSDETLLNGDKYSLDNLKHVGTTLDINGDEVNILNCRIRNGRNVVRIYGGNRDGSKYFIDSLAENSVEEVSKGHIDVRIEGCYITQAKEFLVKVGANRALRASKDNGREPPLMDEHNNPYSTTSGSSTSNIYEGLYNDEYFYSHYVMTDVTLKNSVLETSGLFTIGVESNFSGDMLYNGSQNDFSEMTKDWQRSGGTSFASVVRLEGDVRLYDWKDLNHVDSSTLIEAPTGILREWLNLEIKEIIAFVNSQYPDTYGDLILNEDGKQLVHGGMAFYGGGLNYSQLVLDNLNEGQRDFVHSNMNISVLTKADPSTNMNKQGRLLPLAAGTNDFNFYMYDINSQNSYHAQQTTTNKSSGIKAVQIF